MTDMMKIVPPKFGEGSVKGWELEKAFAQVYRDVFARMDVRYPNNDFSAGLTAAPNKGVTLGNQALPAGRTVGVPALVSKIANNGRAADQRFLPQVSAGNKLSIQSALPLLSTATVSTASIAINPHTLQYGFGAVSCGAGNITGLNPNTTYYVYADDPDYQGGAVSYFASTHAQDIVANNGRYFVGSVTTTIAANTQTVTAASIASPIEITTATDHSWNSGDQVTFATMTGGFAALNGTSQIITVTASNKFTIVVDGSGFSVYTGGGTTTRQGQSTTGGSGGGGGGGPIP